MSEQPKAKHPTITNFEEILHDLDGGVFAEKVGRALSDVALGVVTADKKGEVVLKFSVKKITDLQVQIDHTIKYTAPRVKGRLIEENTTATPMHVGSRGRLTLFPESQPPLFDADAKASTRERAD